MRSRARGVAAYLLAGALAAVGLPACDEPTEGCLDYRALDTDVLADEACGDCCDYPTLRLQLVPARLLGDTAVEVLRAGSLVGDPADSTEAVRVAFYLHDLRVELEDGGAIELTDTLSVRPAVGAGLDLRTVSLLRADPLRTVRYETGTLLEAGRVVGLSAKLGLPEPLRDLNPAAQPERSALAFGADSVLAGGVSGGYRQALWTYERDSVAVTAFAPASGDPATYTWPLAQALALERGFHLDLTVALPLDRLPTDVTGEVAPGALAGRLLAGARVTAASTSR